MLFVLVIVCFDGGLGFCDLVFVLLWIICLLVLLLVLGYLIVLRLLFG